jgi:hypothetical protein
LSWSAFPRRKEHHADAVCFERLVVGGQDRHVDGGGAGLRGIVAHSIRQVLFSHLAMRPGDESAVLAAPWEKTAERVSGTAAAGAGEGADSGGDDFLGPGLVNVFFYGRNDMHRRSIDNPSLLLDAIAAVAHELSLPPPVLIPTFNLAPARQVQLARRMDFFLTVQGAHLQHSLFMPDDAVIFEIAPCRSEGVSFLRRYGRYLDSQRHVFYPLCDDVILNFSEDPDKVPNQNLTLCTAHVDSIAARVRVLLEDLVRQRQQKRRRA